MKYYFSKWTLASLVMPFLAFAFNQAMSNVQGLVLSLWPGSIMLLSLGANENPIENVIYVWSAAIGSNVLIYLLIGIAVRAIHQGIKHNAKNS